MISVLFITVFLERIEQKKMEILTDQSLQFPSVLTNNFNLIIFQDEYVAFLFLIVGNQPV